MAPAFLTTLVSALLTFGLTQATAVSSCPGSASSYFMADDSDPCVFYWCLNGVLISDTPMSCAPGTGVPAGYKGEDNPCTTQNARCKLTTIDPGWQLPQKPSYPPQHPHHPAPQRPAPHYPHHPAPPPAPQYPAPAPAPAPEKPPAAPGHHGYYAATAYLTENAHIPGGMLQPHVHSLKYCWKACVYSYNCKGFDYDTRYSACWLHTDQTVCSPPQYKPYVNNFRLVYCPSTTMAPPTSVTMTTVPTTTTPAPPPIPPIPPIPPVQIPMATFRGKHLIGGSLQPAITTEQACFDACQANPDCKGLDFDRGSNSCWIHSSATECNELVDKPTCTHYRYILCEVPEVYPLTHAVGGSLIADVSDPTTCFALCIDPCVAVDFDSSTMSCWHHTGATCRSLEIKAQCIHLRRPGRCP